MEKTSDVIFSELKSNLESSSIKVEKLKEFAKTGDNKTTYNTVIIKSAKRSDSFELTLNTLKKLKIPYREGKIPGSSFTGITISNYKKQGKREVATRILFKFPDGKDSRSYNIWNEQLEVLFKTHPKLKRVPRDRHEVDIISTINKKINDLGQSMPVTLQIKYKKYQNVVGVVGGVGITKADLIVVTKNGKEVAFISYKSGSGAEDFQQYGGLTDRSGIKISEHPEVQKFHEQILDNWNQGQNWSQDYDSVYRKIQSNNLKNMAVFGKDYAKKSGYNSVDFIVQGNPRITKFGNIIHLNFSTKTVKKKDIGQLKGSYEPTLGVRKGEQSRIIKLKNRSIHGLRSGVFSKKYMKSRPKPKEI